MDIQSKIYGMVRALADVIQPKGFQPIAINERGDNLIAESLPPGVEIVKMGKSWKVLTAAAFASLAAIPTTVAALSLYNNYSDGDLPWCLLIEQIIVSKIVADVTQVNQFGVWGMNNIVPVAAPANSALIFRSNSGRRTYDGKAYASVGLTVTNDGWFPYGTSPPPVSAVAGSPWTHLEIPVKPIEIVPPKGMFNAHIVEVGSAAGQFHLGFKYHEAQLRIIQ